jgi:hypothetical protein
MNIRRFDTLRTHSIMEKWTLTRFLNCQEQDGLLPFVEQQLARMPRECLVLGSRLYAPFRIYTLVYLLLVAASAECILCCYSNIPATCILIYTQAPSALPWKTASPLPLHGIRHRHEAGRET